MDENQKIEQNVGIVLTKAQVIRKIIRDYINEKYTDDEYELLCSEWSYEIRKNRA